MNRKDKKDLARQLFLNTNLFQNEIAKSIGVSEATMSKWCKEWEELKQAYSITKDEVVAHSYKAIAMVYKTAEEETRALTSAECDQINKLGSLIEKVEKKASLPVIIQIFKEFEDFVKKSDLPFAKKVNHLHSLFINSRINP